MLISVTQASQPSFPSWQIQRLFARRLPLLLLLLLVSSPASAAQSSAPGETVQLSLTRYQALMRKASAQASDAAWSRATVSITLPSASGSHLRVTISGDVKTAAKGRGEVLLLPGDQIIESVTVDGSAAPLIRRGGAHLLKLEDPSAPARVQLVLQVPARLAHGGRSAIVALPPVPGATVTISGPESTSAQLWPGGKSKGNGTFEVPATTALAVA